jgi:hypothetical protein
MTRNSFDRKSLSLETSPQQEPSNHGMNDDSVLEL